jgi:glycosyltransferase involved in cell wall biosynthesis
MAGGTPVVCSNAASIPEVVGDAALMFDPTKPEEIAESLLKIIGDESLRRELIKKGKARAALFTWDNTARKTLEFFERVLAGQYDR